MIEIHDVIKIQNLDRDNNSAKEYVAATSLRRIIAVIIILLLMHFLMILPFWQCFWMRTRGQFIGKK